MEECGVCSGNGCDACDFDGVVSTSLREEQDALEESRYTEEEQEDEE